MRNAAQLFAEGVEFADAGGCEPDVGHEPRHHVHLGAELWHREVMQDVDRAELRLDRFAHGQMQLGARDQDVVLAFRIGRVDAERIRVADEPGVDGAEHAVRPRKAIVEVPLPGHDFEHGRVFGDIDELRPRQQAGGQHRDHAHGRRQDEGSLQLFAFGFVVRGITLPVPVAPDAISHEQIDDDEDQLDAIGVKYHGLR